MPEENNTYNFYDHLQTINDELAWLKTIYMMEKNDKNEDLIKKLKDEIVELQSEVNTLQESNESSNKSYEDQIKELNSKNEQYLKVIQEQKIRNEELNGEVAVKELDILKLNNIVKSNKYTLNNYIKRFNELQDQIFQLSKPTFWEKIKKIFYDN